MGGGEDFAAAACLGNWGEVFKNKHKLNWGGGADFAAAACLGSWGQVFTNKGLWWCKGTQQNVLRALCTASDQPNRKVC